MINILLMVQPGFNGNQQSCELFSFLFDNIPKFGDFTNLPPSAEEWIPSSALSFKREEVVAYAMSGGLNGKQVVDKTNGFHTLRRVSNETE